MSSELTDDPPPADAQAVRQARVLAEQVVAVTHRRACPQAEEQHDHDHRQHPGVQPGPRHEVTEGGVVGERLGLGRDGPRFLQGTVQQVRQQQEGELVEQQGGQDLVDVQVRLAAAQG